MYSDIFSRVYDAFGWNYYPESFAQLLWQWIEEKQIIVRNMLDLGCGTGVLCSMMQKHGIKTYGMDLSEGMIKMAKEKYPEIPFDQGNMITWKPGESYDLVTSTCDALNHILDPDDVRKVFQNVYTYVNQGGYFLFDLLREGEARECEPVDLGELDGEKLVNTEKIQERLYDPKWITEELRKAGFSEVRCTDQLLEDHSSHAATWFVVARK